MLLTGSDGDPKQESNLKYSLNFGKVRKIGSLKVLGNISSPDIGNIDGYHKAKNLMDRFFNQSVGMRMGQRWATSNHVVVMFKNSHKSEHALTSSDLDPLDKMNYK